LLQSQERSDHAADQRAQDESQASKQQLSKVDKQLFDCHWESSFLMVSHSHSLRLLAYPFGLHGSLKAK
jgi:hypothetical protein